MYVLSLEMSLRELVNSKKNNLIHALPTGQAQKKKTLFVAGNLVANSLGIYTDLKDMNLFIKVCLYLN